jgi:FkbM family methyltransferase
MTFVSYAQNGEDVLLHRVFGGQETGFYVDVGAYHPVIGSITKAFYDRGWSGINIEPGSVFAELVEARQRDVNLRMAVLDHAGEVAFVEDDADRGMSHVVEGCAVAALMVPCDTLEAIVRIHSRGRPIDFVKVDAEGAEDAIVRSTDWRALRPRVLLLEATRPWSSALANQDWEPVLFQHGYIRAYFDGINCFYIPEEEQAALQRHFQVPVNVLDRAVSHECDMLRINLHERQDEAARLRAQRDTLQHDAALLTGQCDALRVSLQERQDEISRMTAEREMLHGELQERHAEFSRLTAEREMLHGELQERHGELQERHAELTLVTVERDALREVNRLAEAAREQEVRHQQQQKATLAARSRRGWRGVARWAVIAPYKLVRPVVRPAFWRLRSFMTGDLAEQVRALHDRIDSQSPAQRVGTEIGRLMEEMQQLRAQIGTVFTPPPQRVETEIGQLMGEMQQLSAQIGTVFTAEIRQSTVALENALLTLAMEKEVSTAIPTSPPSEPASALTRVNLLLPKGQTAEVECLSGDLSIAQHLLATGGDWEPHVRRYLETVVQPEWVCLDIGANLGVHTLALAVLARQGQVIAFEADASNFALLSRNASVLPAPRAAIRPVHAALWDSETTLMAAGADELAGCTFVASDLSGAEAVERRLRTVVDASAIAEVELHARLSKVVGIKLDDWIKDNPLSRIDLIKLDTEGSELRVIRGADAVLRQYQPILLVEYNPACGTAYFNQSPDILFDELLARFASIYLIEPDGRLTRLADWPSLASRLAEGKGWEDLVCLPHVPE